LHYCAYGTGAQVTDKEKKCNNTMKAEQIITEKNYGMIGNIFHIWDSLEGYRLAKKETICL
jgi:hypothetical protein